MRVRLEWVLACALAAPAAGRATGNAADTDDHAAKLKAAYVYNFLKYAEWPREAPSAGDTNSPFVFAVVGRNGMPDALRSALEGKTVAGRRIRVRIYGDAAALAADFGPADALYLEVSARSEWNAVRTALADRPVLTIAEMPGFCADGGMLNLYEQENHVRFEANPSAARAKGLKLSAELLKLAKIVNSEAPR
jgi:hypothetical protein